MRQLVSTNLPQWVCALVATSPFFGWAQDAIEPEALRFFEAEVRPLLIEHCHECHSAESEKVKGGLRLDTREAWMKGGDFGAVIEPGRPDRSPLIEAVTYENEDFLMPPDYKLSAKEIQTLRRWVAMGAPDPRTEAHAAYAEETPGASHWSFQPISDPEAPTPSNSEWAKTDIDRFLLAGMEDAGLEPAPDTDRYTLLRRLSFDLTGLPPTLKEIQDFVTDERDDDAAIETAVDRLLDDDGFGERWGRHWLDVVRYAESTGMTRNYPYPTAWRYRDYVIDAFNKDKPFEEFVAEQLAGDLLPADSPEDALENTIATGFLAIGPLNLNEGNRQQFAMDVADEQIDVTTRAFMGLTVACARCHDHKFDPIPNEDYYSMAGIFLSADLRSGYAPRQGGNEYFKTELLIPTALIEPDEATGETEETIVEAQPAREEPSIDERIEANKKTVAQLKRFAKALEDGRDGRARFIAQVGRAVHRTPNGERVDLSKMSLEQVRNRIRQLERREQALIAEDENEELRRNIRQWAMGVQEAEKPIEAQLLIQGDVRRRGERQPRGFVDVITPENTVLPPDGQSGRRELAAWISSPDNPLTARVYVNRAWARITGEPIVDSVDNFGATGTEPTNPELLDHLAQLFLNNGGSTKGLVKEIVTSRFYRMRSDHYPPDVDIIDPENRLLSRMNLRRLEVEALRDAMLAVGGTLNRERPEDPAIVATDQASFGRATRDLEGYLLEPMRTIYLPTLRDLLPTMHTTFDFPDPSQIRGIREVTTVPTQGLFMMNAPLVIREAKNLGKRMAEETATPPATRIRRTFLRTLGRLPEPAEQRFAFHYLKNIETGWEELAQALIASAEFRYLL